MLKSVLAFLTVALLSVTVSAEDFKAGTHYEVLPAPVVTHDKNKIEVVELFWYGCGHCFHFAPVFEAWHKKQASDIDVQKQPAMWSPIMTIHAQIFYTAKALGIEDKMHSGLFNAINVEHKRLADPAEIQAFFAKYGVDKATFEKTFSSFGVNSQVKLADSRARSYKMQGTPEIVVNGKYRISSSFSGVGNLDKMLVVADYLIAQERQALLKAK